MATAPRTPLDRGTWVEDDDTDGSVSCQLTHRARPLVSPAKTARDRVLEAAEDLFYREGVRAVGIDTIIARSGVAKMSLYRNFASKDELIVAYLEERNRRFFARWDRAVGPEGANPRVRLRGL